MIAGAPGALGSLVICRSSGAIGGNPCTCAWARLAIPVAKTKTNRKIDEKTRRQSKMHLPVKIECGKGPESDNRCHNTCTHFGMSTKTTSSKSLSCNDFRRVHHQGGCLVH